MSDSPRTAARIAGALYLFVIVFGMFTELFIRGRLIDYADGAVTARNILEHELLYRTGLVAGLLYLSCNVPLAAIFFELFKRVNRSVAMLVAFFTLVGTALESVSLVFYFAPLILLHGRYNEAFAPAQLHALVVVFLRLRTVTFLADLVFFGFYCLSIGYLIVKSTFLPRVLGVLMGIAGMSYLIHSFTTFLVPRFANTLVPYILLPCFVAETSLSLWLLVRGVNVSKWEETKDIHHASHALAT